MTTTPTLSADVDVENARVQITAVCVNDGVGPLAVEVERSTVGSVWVPVRYWSHHTASSGNGWTVTLDDFEAPAGQVLYRARTVAVSNPTNNSVWSPASQVAVGFPAWWLVDVEVPTLRVSVAPEWGDITYTRDRDQGRFSILGRRNPIVVSGVLQGETFTVNLFCDGNDVFDQLERVIEGGRTCLLRDDTGRHWYVAHGRRAATVRATADRAARPIRQVTLPLVEVDPPAVLDEVA